MKTILDILDQIAATPGKNDKVTLVRENLCIPEFAKVLDATLNPYATYHIKQIPKFISKEFADCNDMSLTEFIDDILPQFEARTVSGHAARDLLKECLESMYYHDSEVAIRIIRRSLKAGFNASTVNKARLGTIPVHKCLLASKNTPNSVKKIIFPAYSQIKADGMRSHMFFDDGITIRGRSGKFIDLLGRFDFLAEFGNDIMTDGELVVLEDDGSIMPRAKGNGMLNKCITGSPTSKIVDRVRYVIWDVISMDEFNRPENKADDEATMYDVRWESVKDLVARVNSPKLSQIEHKTVYSMQEVQEHFEEVREIGEEGLIVKNILHPWENRRSQHLVKFKAKYDCDLEVIGWNHGKAGGKWEFDAIGSLRCKSRDGKIIVDVNSGLPDELRYHIRETFDELWLGKIVAIAYNARQDKKGSDIDSLFIPELIELREDKTEADLEGDIEWG